MYHTTMKLYINTYASGKVSGINNFMHEFLERNPKSFDRTSSAVHVLANISPRSAQNFPAAA